MVSSLVSEAVTAKNSPGAIIIPQLSSAIAKDSMKRASQILNSKGPIPGFRVRGLKFLLANPKQV
jgi:hypothetical protein